MWSDEDDQTLIRLVNKHAKRVQIAAAFLIERGELFRIAFAELLEKAW